MPASIYKKIFKDPDCSKLAQIQSEGIYTYTTEKIPMIGSYELPVLHPDDKCFLKVPFHVVSVEGSVTVSCTININLNLIQIHCCIMVLPINCYKGNSTTNAIAEVWVIIQTYRGISSESFFTSYDHCIRF